jgi:hypothetical protein
MKRLMLAFALAASATACATRACPDSCINPDLIVLSGQSDLVSVAGCGVSIACNGGPCHTLELPPPAAGGSCTITVTFSDGTSATLVADWGQPHTSDCGCATFDHTPPFATFHLLDASPD